MKKILSRFKGYTLEDCDCVYCLHYQGRSNPCPLESCCCAEEKAEALKKMAAGSMETPQARPQTLL